MRGKISRKLVWWGNYSMRVGATAERRKEGVWSQKRKWALNGKTLQTSPIQEYGRGPLLSSFVHLSPQLYLVFIFSQPPPPLLSPPGASVTATLYAFAVSPTHPLIFPFIKITSPPFNLWLVFPQPLKYMWLRVSFFSYWYKRVRMEPRFLNLYYKIRTFCKLI